MSTFSAEQLDLSRLPPFSLVTVDEAAEQAALKAGIVARYQARGIPYDVQSLETDFGMIAAEEFAYRKTLDLQALNDAGRNLTMTYGFGAALDQIAATYFADLGLRRLELIPADPANGTPAVMESDERFKLRISLAGEARTFGTLGSYEFLALTVAPFLTDALALNYASGMCQPGEIVLVVLGRDPEPDPLNAIPAQEEPAQLALVQTALLDRDRARSTDTVTVRPARRVAVTRGYTLGIRRGPDPSLVLAEARLQYASYATGQRRIGKLLAESREKAALAVGGVEHVHAADGSGQDIDPGIDAVVEVSDLTLTPQVIGG